MQENLLSIPRDAGRAIIESASVIACPLLGNERFAQFCKERGLSVDADRLLRLERLGLFGPVFRVRNPDAEVPLFSIPLREGHNWFETGWAWDTTAIGSLRPIPDPKDDTQESYYSVFQIDHLDIVLSSMTLLLQIDGFLDPAVPQPPNWERQGKSWLEYGTKAMESLRPHEYRRSKALLCQFISERYYPQTQGDQRTIQVSQRHYSDRWISVSGHDRDWQKFAQSWDPHVAERLFKLTPQKLRHAYEGLALSQTHCDPLQNWYQLVQFVSLSQREKLKGEALKAETLRAGAHMLRLLYKDLYNEELPHPNEVYGTIITHIPELEVRKDVRRYLEFVVNRFGLNPRPTLALIVEGTSEEIAVTKIFEQYFGAHPGTYGIEIIVLGGVDNATGNKEDRFRAIIRMIDYLHHQQTLTFLILDNERYARKLKEASRDAKSIHHRRRYVTRPEYIRVWPDSFEFANFSCGELADALTELAPAGVHFSRREISECKKGQNPGAGLKQLYLQKAGEAIPKKRLTEILVDRMLLPKASRRIDRRPIVSTLARVAQLAARNPFPTMQKIWEMNQASKHLGKKKRP